jgi:hypothetical protein
MWSARSTAMTRRSSGKARTRQHRWISSGGSGSASSNSAVGIRSCRKYDLTYRATSMAAQVVAGRAHAAAHRPAEHDRPRAYRRRTRGAGRYVSAGTAHIHDRGVGRKARASDRHRYTDVDHWERSLRRHRAERRSHRVPRDTQCGWRDSLPVHWSVGVPARAKQSLARRDASTPARGPNTCVPGVGMTVWHSVS